VVGPASTAMHTSGLLLPLLMRALCLLYCAAVFTGCGGRGSSAPVTSTSPVTGAPGRFIVFQSNRPGGAGGYDVYLYDRQTNAFAALPGLNTDQDEGAGGLSDDGRFIAFSQGATGLFANPPEQARLYDRLSNALVQLSGLNVQGEIQGSPYLSADGRFLVFGTIRQGDTTGNSDVKLYDTQTTGYINLPGLNSSAVDNQPSISADGRFIAFHSNRSGGAGGDDIYLYDRQTQALIAVPGLNSSSNEAVPSLSRDGRLILFHSDRSGGAGPSDIYLYDRQTSSLVSLPQLNTAADESFASFSSDGRFIVFSRFDNDSHTHVHLYDRQTQTEVPLPGLNASGSDDLGPRMN